MSLSFTLKITSTSIMFSQIFSAWVSNQMPSWDGITYPSLNFNGCTVGIWEWISNFVPHFIMDVLSYPRGLKSIHALKSIVAYNSWRQAIIWTDAGPVHRHICGIRGRRIKSIGVDKRKDWTFPACGNRRKCCRPPFQHVLTWLLWLFCVKSYLYLMYSEM